MPESFDEAFPGGFDECVSTLGQEDSVDDPEALCGWLQENGFEEIRNSEPDDVLVGLGVEYVSVVDEPAQDSEWLVAKSAGADPDGFDPANDPLRGGEFVLKDSDTPETSEDPERKVWAAVLIPGEVDKQGDLVPEPEIERAAHNYLKRYRKVDEDHSLDDGSGEPIESYVLKQETTFDLPDGSGSRTYPEGTWIMGVELTDEAWKRVESGELSGFSIYGGAASLEPDDLLTEKQKSRMDVRKQDYAVSDRVEWEFSTGLGHGRVEEVEDTPGNQVSVGSDGTKSGNDIVRVADEDEAAYIVEVWNDDEEEFGGFAVKTGSELNAWSNPPEAAAKSVSKMDAPPEFRFENESDAMAVADAFDMDGIHQHPDGMYMPGESHERLMSFLMAMNPVPSDDEEGEEVEPEEDMSDMDPEEDSSDEEMAADSGDTEKDNMTDEDHGDEAEEQNQKLDEILETTKETRKSVSDLDDRVDDLESEVFEKDEGGSSSEEATEGDTLDEERVEDAAEKAVEKALRDAFEVPEDEEGDLSEVVRKGESFPDPDHESEDGGIELDYSGVVGEEAD